MDRRGWIGLTVAVAVTCGGLAAPTIARADSGAATISIVAGGGVNSAADGAAVNSVGFARVQQVAVAADGSLLFADTAVETLWRSDGTLLHQVAGSSASNSNTCATGDGGPAVSALFGFRGPTGIAIGPSGDIDVSDWDCNTVRQVDTAGTITRLAGTVSSGFAGDDGPAINAMFYTPGYEAFDHAGDLFVIDSNNYRVRKITPDGTISTVAGNGSPTYTGDGVPATSTGMAPVGIAIAGDNALLIATGVYPDYESRILRVDPQTGIVTTLAGTGAAGFSGDGGLATAAQLSSPKDVAVDSGGAIFVADTGNGRVRRIDPTTGIITTVAGGGSQAASLSSISATDVAITPFSIAITPTGDLIVVDYNQSQDRSYILKVPGIAVPPPPPPPPSAITASVSPTTPLWKLDLTIKGAPSCAGSPHLTITIAGRTDKQLLCKQGAPVAMRWPVFAKNYLLQPDSVYPATATVPELGQTFTGTIHTPKAPVWVAVGDSYSSGHHQDADLPSCVVPDATCGLFPNDPNFAWPTRAVALVNQNYGVPVQWRMTADVEAQSGKTTGQYGDQTVNMVQQLGVRANSWNVVSLTGGGNDVDLVFFIGQWYATHVAQMNVVPGPWAIAGPSFASPQAARDACPRTDLEWLDLQAKKSTILANLQGIINAAEAVSPGVRVLDVNYPFVVPTTNPCSQNYTKRTLGVTDTFKGAKAIVDGLAQVHDQLTASALYNIDLRTGKGFGTSPMQFIETTRLFGYPHPTDGGQNLIAGIAAVRIK